MNEWLDYGPFTFFDLETTGLSPIRDRIIQIGALRLEKDGSVSRFNSLVNPGIPIPSHIQEITGITDADLEKASVFSQVAPTFLKYSENSKLLAHNAHFDLSFLQESLARCGLGLLDGAYDTIPIVRRAFPGLVSYSLQSLRNYLPVSPDIEGKAHDASFDAEITCEIFKMAMNVLWHPDNNKTKNE